MRDHGRRAFTAIERLDQRVFAAQARAHWPLGDAVLPRLTHAADRSALWMVVAAGLAAGGGRAGRRAAVRGIASTALASGLANLVVKRLVPRARPLREGVPPLRRARRMPASTSFPSGHSASAAAFAVGAAIEQPALALPIGLTAAAVGWSRVYTGVHHPSDVLAGAALGAVAATTLARGWRWRTARMVEPRSRR